jgi:hypothetical protein
MLFYQSILKRCDTWTFLQIEITRQIANLAEVLRSCEFLFIFNSHAVDFDLSAHNPSGNFSYFIHVFNWQNRTLTLGATVACISFYSG